MALPTRPPSDDSSPALRVVPPPAPEPDEGVQRRPLLYRDVAFFLAGVVVLLGGYSQFTDLKSEVRLLTVQVAELTRAVDAIAPRTVTGNVARKP